jgi:hypothetical protein
MLIYLFEYKGIVHQEFVSAGQTINKKFYLLVLEHLEEQVHCVRPELFPDKWILHHRFWWKIDWVSENPT